MSSPARIYELLSEKVVGQHEAKQKLSNIVFAHAVKVHKHYTMNVAYGVKSNLLILGPTGCGKSYMMKTLRDRLNFPVITINALYLTNEGWHGRGLAEYFTKEYTALKAECGSESARYLLSNAIIFIDEVDKLCYQAMSNGGGDHNRFIQHGLLSAVEEQDIEIGKGVGVINTKNMLFIFGGNFEDLRNQLKNFKPKTMGFAAAKPVDANVDMLHQELIKAGLIPELVGRISNFTVVSKLTEKELKQALLNVNGGVLQQYRELFDYIGYDLELSDYHIKKIVKRCHKSDLGARGLVAAVEEVLEGMIYQLETDINLGIFR